ncbi:transcriptional regulator, TetR family [Lachnospiraceae bacterium G11]|nr:transcriptional regulator, TetR family [Lachnospiraceae bacterium G11]
MNTKELILEEALKQFSKKGYDGTSMSDIAAPLGISKAALYKHFASKQQIFDRIIVESEEKYKDFFEKLSVHLGNGKNVELNKKDVDVYTGISAEGLSENVLTFVRFSMTDEYSKQVRQMMTISQFQSKELGEMYTKRYVDAMLGYDEKLFEQLIQNGAIKKGDPKVLAAMFYAPVIMYMGIWDREPNRAKECEKAIKNHVEQFFQMTRSTG